MKKPKKRLYCVGYDVTESNYRHVMARSKEEAGKLLEEEEGEHLDVRSIRRANKKDIWLGEEIIND